MLKFPNAKINLGLQITAKRSNGYHTIETVMYPFTALTDALEIIAADTLSFTNTGIDIPESAAGNLCLKAYELLAKEYALTPLSIHLHKNIPIGAGLGGGSADGAYMLRMLQQHFQLPISDEKLAAYAAQLGSDCPFFIYNKPLLATGTGTEFTACDVNLSAYYLVLVCPQVHVSTKAAYAQVQPKTPAVPLRTLIQLPVHEWKDIIVNDFETSVFNQFPSLKGIKNTLYNAGAVYAAMSGSGSALFGIFEQETRLDEQLKDCRLFYQDSKSK